MGLRTSLSHFRAARRGTPHLAAPIQLASAAWRHKVKNTNQQTRSVRGQPAEAPHLAIQRRVALPLGQMAAIAVPFLMFQFEIRWNELAQGTLYRRALAERAKRIEHVEGEPLGVLHQMSVRIHVDIEPLAGVALVLDAIDACRDNSGLQQIRIGRGIPEPKLKPAGFGDTDHVGAVVAGIRYGVGGAGRARWRSSR